MKENRNHTADNIRVSNTMAGNTTVCKACKNGRKKYGYLRLLITAFCILTLVIESLLPLASVNAEEVRSGGTAGYVSAETLNLRTGPGTNYDKVQLNGSSVVMKRGQNVAVFTEYSGWYFIALMYNGSYVEGYASAQYISMGENPYSAGNPSEALSGGAAGYVNAETLNLRTGPGTGYDKVKLNGEYVVMTKGQDISMFLEKDGWFFVVLDYKGSTVSGYAYSPYIVIGNNPYSTGNGSSGSGSSTDGSGSGTGSGSGGSTGGSDSGTGGSTGSDSGSGNGTGTGSDSGSGTGTGSDSGNSGSGSDSGNPADPEIIDPGKQEEETDTRRVLTLDKNGKFEWSASVTANTLNVRSGAGTSYSKKGTLTKGAVVTVTKTKTSGTERWYRIVCTINGKKVTGYVLSDYVKLDFSENIPGQAFVSKVYLKQSPEEGAQNVKSASGKTTIKMKKNYDCTIISEETGADGVKWFKIVYTYKKVAYTGYVKATDLKFKDLIASGEAVYKKKSSSGTGTETELDILRKEYSAANGKLNSSAAGLAVKAEPAYQSTAIRTSDGTPVFLYEGHPIQVVGEAESDEVSWYQIKFMYGGTEYSGYISTKYAEILVKLDFGASEEKNGSNEEEMSFEDILKAEGFPKSYRKKLLELHEKYPLWEFKALKTGLKWSDVIANETGVGKNLIESNVSLEWLSFENKAYDWSTDTFIPYDGSVWVTASKAATEYYMDPRNFLDENTIFQFEVLTYQPSYQNSEGIDHIISNTAMGGTSFAYTDANGITRNISYTDAFLMAAEYTGASPFHLASRVKQEVVIGTTLLSTSVCGTVPDYEGLYNYYNIGAYHSTQVGGAVRNGLKFAKNGSSSATLNQSCLIPWSNRFRSILGGAYYIANNYIYRGQDTIYLQKFNVTGSNTYSHQYMANIRAPWSEGKRVFTGYSDVASRPIVFSIPVYEDMPSKAVAAPEKMYNPNNRMSSITIKNAEDKKLSVTPSFSQTVTEYSLIVPYNHIHLDVKGVAVSKKSTVSGNGTYELEVGVNTITLSVTAENGEVKDYVITVVREENPNQEVTPEPTPELTPEPTPEATPEPTPEITPETTPDPGTPTETPSPTPDDGEPAGPVILN